VPWVADMRHQCFLGKGVIAKNKHHQLSGTPMAHHIDHLSSALLQLCCARAIWKFIELPVNPDVVFFRKK